MEKGREEEGGRWLRGGVDDARRGRREDGDGGREEEEMVGKEGDLRSEQRWRREGP